MCYLEAPLVVALQTLSLKDISDPAPAPMMICTYCQDQLISLGGLSAATKIILLCEKYLVEQTFCP
jgi:hypothetical protein